jgi:hypothetical protein
MHRVLKKYWFSIIIPLLFVGNFAFAACTSVDGKYDNPICGVWDAQTIPEFLGVLVDLALAITMPLVVVFIIYAGFKFVTAGDSDANRESARSIFFWTMVGAGVIIAAKVLSEVIQATILSLKGP